MTQQFSPDAAQAIVAALPEPRLILVALQEVQAAFGYVPDAAVPIVAGACGVSRADVHGVLTFYSDLRRTPPPAVEIRVCMGEACQAVGSRPLMAHATGLASPDVEVHEVFCVGNCALGPSAVVGDRLIGRCDDISLAAALGSALEQAR